MESGRTQSTSHHSSDHAQFDGCRQLQIMRRAPESDLSTTSVRGSEAPLLTAWDGKQSPRVFDMLGRTRYCSIEPSAGHGTHLDGAHLSLGALRSTPGASGLEPHHIGPTCHVGARQSESAPRKRSLRGKKRSWVSSFGVGRNRNMLPMVRGG